jgi:hypothetical protein
MYPDKAKVYFLSDDGVRRPLSWYKRGDIPKHRQDIAKTGFLRLEQDREDEGIELLLWAAWAGHIASRRRLGLMYSQGWKVTAPSIPEVWSNEIWLRDTDMSGFEDKIYNNALRAERNFKDGGMGFFWKDVAIYSYSAAAKAGHHRAILGAARAFFMGEFGSKDRGLGLAWAKYGCIQGVDGAKDLLRELRKESNESVEAASDSLVHEMVMRQKGKEPSRHKNG